METKSSNLAEQGLLKIEWASQAMPTLGVIRDRFRVEKPLRGVRISACLHVTAETANLMQVLISGGAEVRLCGSNPLSTKDDVASALLGHEGIEVFAIGGEDKEAYFRHIHSVLDHGPSIIMDDGADLTSVLLNERKTLTKDVKGGTEETTTGVTRLKAMAEKGVLTVPVIAINNANTKHMFDNRYGTGQSAIDGIIRATNRLLAGSCFVVCGYGWCGRGLALRAQGMGARVIVTEVNPIRALEAAMDGYQVMPISKAARLGDIFCTVTGDIHVIRKEHFERMKDGAIICNAGHFNVELDLDALFDMSTARRVVRDALEEFQIGPGQRIYVLGQGRLVNLAAAEGHPASVMDMSFANQALCVEHLVANGHNLQPGVHNVPPEIDRDIASLKLKGMGISIDTLTEEQSRYMSSWEMGT